MQHYFLKSIVNDTCYFIDDDIHHILHVMRFRNDDNVVGVFDGKQYLIKLNINDNVTGKIVNQINHKITDLNVTLIHGLPKNDKFELALQKATEIGVTKIVPFLCDRSVIKINESDFEKKIIRYEKILKEASEQSERNEIPKITKPIYLKDINKYKSDINIICDETYGRVNDNNIFDVLSDIDNKSITFVVGPEGGFSSNELKYFNDNGFISIGLGNNILRSETAVIYFLSCLSMLRK